LSRAHAKRANIVKSAGVPVLATRIVEDKLATQSGVAGVIGAGIAVVANKVHAADAPAEMTVISKCTDVLVVARSLIHDEQAPQARVAHIVGAEVVIAALHRTTEDALAAVTMVVHGAGVAIVAGRLVGDVDAALPRVARVVGANVAIVTDRDLPFQTSFRRVAVLRPVAEVSIVAQERFAIEAPDRRVASLKTVAEVGVAALQRRTSDASAAVALVPRGAHVVVGTGEGIILKNAAYADVAGIVGAGIPIVAAYVDTLCAHTLEALVNDGASVAVVAQETLVIGDQRTLPGGCIAMSLQAERVFAVRLGADWNGQRIACALEGELFHVADESTVAKISVLQPGAILVALAVALNRRAEACALGTMVADRTRVPVVALSGGRGVFAAAGFGADVVGAGVLVVTLHRVTHAFALFAMVGNGARVAVQALSAGKIFVQAAGFAVTCI